MQDLLTAFRLLLFADVSMQRDLGDVEIPDLFIMRAREAAQSLGLAISSEELAAALRRPDPLGLSSPDAAETDKGWPPTGWLPVDVLSTGAGRVVVDWAYFGTTRLDDPFFEMSARRARCRPFNRLCRWRMDIESFMETSPDDSLAPPRGLIFHMSRCGSTLVAQMLASSPRNIVLSEAPPIDAVTRLRDLRPIASEEDRRRALSVMTAALSRRRSGAETRLFLKLDSWHSIDLPLFRAAFPSTPWVFLYRNPIEVLVSQMRLRGIQTVPGVLPPEILGVDDGAALGGEEFCARVLAKTCAAAIEHFQQGGGLMVNYDELPEAVFTKILPHFGVSADAAEIDAMRRAALRDAKAPHIGFSSDGDAKRRAATPRAHAAVAHWLVDIYAELESLRSARGR
jgi:hypothetical protein